MHLGAVVIPVKDVSEVGHGNKKIEKNARLGVFLFVRICVLQYIFAYCTKFCAKCLTFYIKTVLFA